MRTWNLIPWFRCAGSWTTLRKSCCKPTQGLANTFWTISRTLHTFSCHGRLIHPSEHATVWLTVLISILTYLGHVIILCSYFYVCITDPHWYDWSTAAWVAYPCCVIGCTFSTDWATPLSTSACYFEKWQLKWRYGVMGGAVASHFENFCSRTFNLRKDLDWTWFCGSAIKVVWRIFLFIPVWYKNWSTDFQLSF